MTSVTIEEEVLAKESLRGLLLKVLNDSIDQANHHSDPNKYWNVLLEEFITSTAVIRNGLDKDEDLQRHMPISFEMFCQNMYPECRTILPYDEWKITNYCNLNSLHLQFLKETQDKHHLETNTHGKTPRKIHKKKRACKSNASTN